MSPPAEVVNPPDASLYGSLRLTLSREPKRTLALERELTSGDVSGRSSALMGVTVKRTDEAMASRGCWGSDRAAAPGSCGGGRSTLSSRRAAGATRAHASPWRQCVCVNDASIDYLVTGFDIA